MNGDIKTPADRDTELETFAAELAQAAYGVALRHGTGSTWLDLELEFWHVLADTVRMWERQLPRCR